MPLVVLAVAAAAVAAGLGWRAWHRDAGEEPAVRAVAALLPAALAVLAPLYAGYVAAAPQWHWNSARVVPPVAIARGFDLYYGPDAGPALTTLYGPVKELLYLPAALAATPTAAILVAATLNVLTLLAPLALILAGGAGDRRRRLAGLAAFAFAAAALLLPWATRYMATAVHVDAPAVGLGLLSCWALGAGPPTRRRLAVASLLGALATWTKQVEAPLVAAQALWLGLAGTPRKAVELVAGTAAWGLALGLAFAALFGLEPMLFQVVTLPAGHPWLQAGGWFVLGLVELAILGSFSALVVLLGLRAAGPPRTGEWLRERPWTLHLLAALALAPTSVLGRTILGGDVNSYHSLVYLLVAAALVLSRGELVAPSERGRRLAPVVAGAVAGAALVAALPQLAVCRHLARPWANPEERALAIARANPGRVFFPWNPLSALLADGRLDHFDYAVGDRRLGGFPMSEAHFRAHLPPDLRWVLLPDDAPGASVLPYLPELARVEVEGFPGWVVYARPEDAAGPARPPGG